jgi:predicted  nucleic acid-binding Zn-ribbon protein
LHHDEGRPQVQFLREIRDNTLLSTDSGTSFMTGFNQFYYSFSPAVADLERENAMFRDAVRVAITPGLYTLNIMTLADQNSDASVIAFGLLAIAAMAGIYVAGPVLTVHAIRKRARRA